MLQRTGEKRSGLGACLLKINQACDSDIVQPRCWQWEGKTAVCLNVYLKKEKDRIIIVVRKQCVRCLCRIQRRATALVEQSADVATKKAIAPLFLLRKRVSIQDGGYYLFRT